MYTKLCVLMECPIQKQNVIAKIYNFIPLFCNIYKIFLNYLLFSLRADGRELLNAMVENCSNC